MKTICKILFLATIIANTTVLSSCSKDDNEPAAKTIAVNYVTINGVWKLSKWCGNDLPEGNYCYIVFDRINHTYKMYDNMQSMYAHYTTGTFTIKEDPYLGSVISGMYDFGNGKWNHEYIVSEMLETGSMVWTVSGNADDYSLYVRAESVPQDIIDECRGE